MRNSSLIAAASLVSGLLAGSVAVAQTNGANWNWGGFYVDGALGARSSSTQVTNSQRWNTTQTFTGAAFSSTTNSTSTDFTQTDVGNANFLAQISLGWRWAGGPLVVGIGLFGDLAGNDAGSDRTHSTFKSNNTTSLAIGGTTTTTNTANASSTVSKMDIKQKNRYGISLDAGPNWRTSPYAKLSFDWSEYEYSASTGDCAANTGPSAVAFTNTHTGLGLGAGVRHLQTDNLYFFAEVMWQTFESMNVRGRPLCSQGPAVAGMTQNAVDEVRIRPSNVSGVVGVGYKF